MDNLIATGGAFADVEDAIETVKVKASDNDSEVDAKLWLLSIAEANNLPEDARKSSQKSGDANAAWWLRSPGGHCGSCASFVNGWYGNVDSTGYFVQAAWGVRPALNLNLSSVVFLPELKQFLTKGDVTGISIDKSAIILEIGATSTEILTATVTPTDTNAKAIDRTVIWSSSDTGVATVDNNGNVTAVAKGTATITATATNGTTDTADNKAATCTVTVKQPVSYIVTFKVVNGSWDDTTTVDRAVILTGYEGDKVKIGASQIPQAGTKPNDGYKPGSWDKTPSTDTVIIATTTYTYTYAKKDAAVFTKIPIAKKLIYNGDAQELVTTGETTEGTIQYYLGTNDTAIPAESAYTTFIPKGTNAGTYYVWYKIMGDKNHSDSTPVCVIITIAEKSVPEITPVSATVSTAKDAFTRVNEAIEISTNGTAVVTSVVNTVGKTLRVTGTVNQSGTDYAVSRFATKSFSNVDVKNINIDLKISGNTQTVTFMPRSFKGSKAKKLILRLTSSDQVKFSSGALSGSKIKKVVVFGLNKKDFKGVQIKLMKSGYTGKIIKK